jgi:hypothetical protein
VRLTDVHVVRTTSAAVVTWSVHSLSSRLLTGYGARVYVFRANGGARGFRTVHLKANLAPGAHRADTATLELTGAETGLEPGAVIVLAPTTVLFERDPPWREPGDAVQRAKQEVLRIVGA